MVFTTEGLFAALNSVEISGHEFNSYSEPTLYSYSNFIICSVSSFISPVYKYNIQLYSSNNKIPDFTLHCISCLTDISRYTVFHVLLTILRMLIKHETHCNVKTGVFYCLTNIIICSSALRY